MSFFLIFLKARSGSPLRKTAGSGSAKNECGFTALGKPPLKISATPHNKPKKFFPHLWVAVVILNLKSRWASVRRFIQLAFSSRYFWKWKWNKKLPLQKNSTFAIWFFVKLLIYVQTLHPVGIQLYHFRIIGYRILSNISDKGRRFTHLAFSSIISE